MEFLEYELTSQSLCLGERVKGTLFRPCDTKTIRYSAITGALRELWGVSDLHAAGWLIQDKEHNKVDYLVYSPQDKVLGKSKIPLTVQFLSNVKGKVYVKRGKWEAQIPDGNKKVIELSLGALKSHGFGHCQLKLIGVVEGHRILGRLRTRIPLDLISEFDIIKSNDLIPRYGYLFRPTSETEGTYVLSLFEGSQVRGPDILVEGEDYERRDYDIA